MEPTPSLAEVAGLLACPNCGLGLTPHNTRQSGEQGFGVGQGTALRCARGHSFDVARQGYVSLLTGASTKMTGDTAAMLDARSAFQRGHFFAPIAAAVASASSPADPTGTALEIDTVLEIGAGTGYYLAEVLDAVATARGIALDVAKPAARRCARAHPRAAAVLADAWRGLPIQDHAVDRVLSVFAPRNPGEVARVLDPGGRFVVVTPTEHHLAELVGPLGMVTVDEDKDRRLDDAMSGHFTLVDRTHVEYSMALGPPDVANVVAMGPSAHHGTADRLTALHDIAASTDVTASVRVSTYSPCLRTRS